MELYFIVGNVVMLLHEKTFYRCFPFLFLLFAVQICCVAMGAACNRNGEIRARIEKLLIFLCFVT